MYPTLLHTLFARLRACLSSTDPLPMFWTSEAFLALANLGKHTFRETKHQKGVLSELYPVLKLSTSDNARFAIASRLCQAVLANIPKASSLTTNTFKLVQIFKALFLSSHLWVRDCMQTMLDWLEAHEDRPDLATYSTEVVIPTLVGSPGLVTGPVLLDLLHPYGFAGMPKHRSWSEYCQR